LIGERRRGLFRVSPPPASALVLADLTPAVLPRAAALLHPFECHCHPSLGFRRPARFDRKSAAVPSVYSTYSARPLSWGSAPSSGHQRKGSGVIRGFPHPRPLRPQGSNPLDALIPFAPSPVFLPEAAPGIATFRAFLLPPIRILFRGSVPSWHCLTRRSNASSSTYGTHHHRGS
jgi:hypothetical protein